MRAKAIQVFPSMMWLYGLAPVLVQAPCLFGRYEVIYNGTRCVDFEALTDTPFLDLASQAATYLVGIVIIAALIVTVGAGYIYMTAGGSAERVSLAKKLVGGAILGIILALLSYTILNFINPQFASDPVPVKFLPHWQIPPDAGFDYQYWRRGDPVDFYTYPTPITSQDPFR